MFEDGHFIVRLHSGVGVVVADEESALVVYVFDEDAHGEDVVDHLQTVVLL